MKLPKLQAPKIKITTLIAIVAVAAAADINGTDKGYRLGYAEATADLKTLQDTGMTASATPQRKTLAALPEFFIDAYESGK